MGKLAVSNIAWSKNVPAILEMIANLGVSGVEVAPGKLAPWAELHAGHVAAYRKLCAGLGLSIPSFQAILFGKPDLQLLGDHAAFNALKEHFNRMAALASVAGAHVMVFGAPSNRLLLGNSILEGEHLALERLAELAEVVWKHETSIGLEAVPTQYGAEMITRYRTSLDLVRAVNHPGLVFHLDAACTCLAEDSLRSAVGESQGLLRHFHVSQPHLGDFAEMESYHYEAAEALVSVGYDRWICIEMRETAEPETSLMTAIRSVRETYFSSDGWGGAPAGGKWAYPD